MIGGCGTHKTGVAVDVAAVKRDGAAFDVDATTLRSQREGQHSSVAMERYMTRAGGGVYLLPARQQAEEHGKGWVSTPAGGAMETLQGFG